MSQESCKKNLFARDKSTRPTVLNLGLERFAADVETQAAQSVHIDWKPPAGGNLRLIEILEKLKELDEQ